MSKTDAAFMAALALIVAGVAAMYWPMAFVVAGVLVAALAATHERGRARVQREALRRNRSHS
jgi:membrane protein implicated in regulation of membrane protease activity